MNKAISAFLLSSVASFALAGVAAAQSTQPKPQYTAEELVKAFSAPAAEQAQAATEGGECAARGMVAGDDGVCEPAKDSRGFSLPTRAEPAKGETRGFSLPNRAAKGDTRGFSLPQAKGKQQQQQPARANPEPRSANANNRNRNNSPRSASTPRAAAPAAIAARRDLFISFEPGSAQLTQQAQANARVFAQALTAPQLASARFEIQGHTDASGSREQNVLLSQRRAEAVRAYLVSLGVDAGRLEAKGYGFDQLAAPANPRSPENRRVEASRLN